MKIFKNRLFFFINSVIIYLVLQLLVVCPVSLLVEEYANGWIMNNFAGLKNHDSSIAEIVIDDTTLKKFPDWDGNLYADLLDYFHTYAKPKIVGFDINIDSMHDDTPSAKRMIDQMSKMNNLVMALVPVGAPEGVKNYPSVSDKTVEKYSINTKFNTSELLETPYIAIKGHNDDLNYAIYSYGSVLLKKNPRSNIVMNATNIVKIKDSYFPSLPFKMYLLNNGTNDVVVDSNFIYVPKTGLKIPYYGYGDGTISNFIRFYPDSHNVGYSHDNISALRILETYKALKRGITPENSPELFDEISDSNDYINPAFFSDKSVFIGYNISGDKADILSTPMNVSHSGVDIQATIYDNLKNNHFWSCTSVSVAFWSYILLSLISFILIMRLRFVQGILALIFLDVIFMFFVFLAATNDYLMCFATPIFGQFITSIFGYSFKFVNENRNKEKIKQAMGKYLSYDVMKNVVSNIEDLKLGGKRAVVTVLFSDIRGFTSLSEKMSAEEVSMILNEYFSEMEPIIAKYNGVINKFIGDAVMALFGEPIQDINHPKNAVKCAYEMLKKVEYLREKWLFEGKPNIEIGIGINTGEVFIGNIGTESRMEYTVIGDTVNLASRIETYNKVYKTNLLVSSSTYSYISDIADVIKISEVQIRGKSKKMDIYEVLRIIKD